MALVFSTNHESGSVATIYNSSSGTPTIVTAGAPAPPLGSQVLQCAGAPSTAWAQVTHTGLTTLVLGYRWRRVSSNGDFALMKGESVFDRLDYIHGGGSTRRLSYTFGTQSSTQIVAGTWYWLTFRLVISGGTLTYVWAIDGVAQTGGSFATGGAFNLTRLGFIEGQTASQQFDDVYIYNAAADYPVIDPALAATRTPRHPAVNFQDPAIF